AQGTSNCNDDDGFRDAGRSRARACSDSYASCPMENTSSACNTPGSGTSSTQTGCTPNGRSTNGGTNYAPGSGTSSATTNLAQRATGSTKASSFTKAAKTPCAGH